MSPRKKEEWIEVTEAAAIISEKNGHEVSVDYVRLLANQGKIQRQRKNARENLYLKSDVESIKVRQRRKAVVIPVEQSPEELRNDLPNVA